MARPNLRGRAVLSPVHGRPDMYQHCDAVSRVTMGHNEVYEENAVQQLPLSKSETLLPMFTSGAGFLPTGPSARYIIVDRGDRDDRHRERGIQSTTYLR